MNSLAFSPANSSKHSILFESELHIIIHTHMQNKNIQKTTNDDFRSHENFKPLIEICNLKRLNEKQNNILRANSDCIDIIFAGMHCIVFGFLNFCSNS